MIHFLPESFDDCQPLAAAPRGAATPGPYAEAVARLSAIREALSCVEQLAGAEPSRTTAEAKLAAAWPVASPARQRAFDSRSARTAAGAAAGLEALAQQDANPAATDRLHREIASGVDSIDRLFSL